MSAYLQIDHLSKSFARGTQETEVLHDITLTIEQGEYVSIIGHSGCGKSTLLNIVAGLLPCTTGGVLLENREVNEPGPDRAVVFQNHSLLPWLTVYDNVSIAVNKVFGGVKSRAERHDWVMHNLDLVQMAHAKDKRPAEISGGMKQRVGLARALSMEPKVLLLDEPFGALDALTRAHLQDSVMAIHAKLGNTVLMITHDVDEAVLLSDRIVMMTNGPSAQIGEVLDVPLARPRKRLSLAADPTYLKCRQRVLEFLYERHRFRRGRVTETHCRDSGEQAMTPESQTRAGEFRESRADLEQGRRAVLWPPVRDRAAGPRDVSRRHDRAAQEADGDARDRGQRPQQSRRHPSRGQRARQAPRVLRRASPRTTRWSAKRCCGRSKKVWASPGRRRSRMPGPPPTRRCPAS